MNCLLSARRLGGIAVGLAAVATLLVAPITARAAAPMEWTNHGPFGGYPTAFSVHPVNSEVVLVGTREGIFKTDDGGGHWSPASRGLSDLDVNALAFDVHKPSIAYAGTFDGLFRSTDGGESWAFVDGLDQNNTIDGVEVSRQHPGRVYAFGSWSVLRSNDYGKTWRQIFKGNPEQVGEVALAPSNDRILYMSTANVQTGDDDRIYRSSDSGETWTRLPFRIWTGTIAVDPANANRVFVIDDRGVFRTKDGGQNWSKVWDNYDSRNAEARNVVMSESAPSRIYVGGSFPSGRFVASSTDGADTWQTTRLAGFKAHPAMAVDRARAETLYFGGAEGIRKSEDGGITFRRQNHGLRGAPATSLDSDPFDARLLYASVGASGLFRSRDAGGSWTSISEGLRPDGDPYVGAGVRRVAVDAGGAVFATVQLDQPWFPERLYRSEDQGESWAEASIDTGDGPTAGRVVPHPVSTGRLVSVAGRTGQVYRTSDGGRTWNRVHTFNSPLAALEIDPETQMLFASVGADEAGTDGDERLMRSRDFGDTWERMSYPDLRHVGSIGVDPTTKAIFAGSSYSSAVARSTDLGESWEVRRVDPTNDASEILTIAVDPLDPKQVFAGTLFLGVWISQDRGTTWRAATPGVRGQTVMDLTFGRRHQGLDHILRARPLFAGLSKPGRSGVARSIPPPHNRVKPSVNGERRVGEVLACAKGEWSRASAHYYRWLRDGHSIDGATNRTYEVGRQDRGTRLSCRVRARGPGGSVRVRSDGVVIRNG